MSAGYHAVCGKCRKSACVAVRYAAGNVRFTGDAAALGVRREALASRIGSPCRDRLGNVVGWTFADGSEIEESGGGWDTPEGWASQA